ncbi:corticosteroid- binding protein [Desmophyllum pertusum]|uniref:Corticosteroid- binding protein n=1 Tax=Desmophyllum pertusum TaxID=174260 RepID=A0A9W9ZBE8_9CNID|nr:corticosteroid- binding protein [Desmophyllum pertusum]
MHRVLVFAFLFCVLGKCLCEEPGSLKLGRVIRATPANQAQVNFLKRLAENDALDLDFWTHPSHIGGNVDIRVTTSHYPRLAKLLHANEITFTILIPDVQRLVDTENPPRAVRAAGFDYGRYNRWSDIKSEMMNLVHQYSNLATLVSIGKTYEGRALQAIKISSGLGGSGQKKMFFINCGIHAREWVTQATCMYMIRQQMLSGYGKDSSVTAMVDKLDWVIMPVFNVDGYEYTFTSYRMWRKTRSRNPGSSCIGTDPNRNWNFKWGGIGTSSNPCRDTYHGSRPFSEVEVLSVARYLYSNRHNMIGYMDIHAYSQLWLTPWGYTRSYPRDYKEMERVSNIAVRALYAKYRTSYKVGPSSIIIYANSGSTKDWAYGVLGVKYAFALELRDKGRYGFMLPSNQIMPTGIETFDAIKAMGAALRI